MRHSEKHASTTKFKSLYKKFGGRCHYCWVQVILNADVSGMKGTVDRWATRDHLWPMCRGGMSDEDNIVLACHSCNNRKSERSILDIVKAGWKGFGHPVPPYPRMVRPRFNRKSRNDPKRQKHIHEIMARSLMVERWAYTP